MDPKFRDIVSYMVLAATLVFVAFLLSTAATADGGTLGKFRAYQVTCNSTARTLAASTGVTPGNAFKFKVTGATAYFGGDDVDTSTLGLPYAVGESDTFDANPGALYCKSAGTATITILAGNF